MESTKVAHELDTSKLIVIDHIFNLHDNAYDVLVSEESKLSESWNEQITMDEIRDHVTTPTGMVDASIRSPFTKDNVEQYIDFDYYMNYEFENEAKFILASILNNRSKEEAA
ncbi:MAG: hypothetical protein WC756_11995 [Taibaiella sp.]|jgi:hypothetical protein